LKIAKINGLRPWQQEKHYMQSLILNILSEFQLVFKGGTYLWFFHGLRRFSEDLDFTLDAGSRSEEIPEKVSHGLELFGIDNSIKVTKAKNAISFRISAEGPLNTRLADRCIVYVDLSMREKIVEPAIPIKLDFPEYGLPVKRMLGMNLEEVGAEKVRAILTRKKSRDIYDLYYLINKKGIRFNEKLINKKMEYYKEVFSMKSFSEEINSREEHYYKEMKGIIFDDLPGFNKISTELIRWASTESK
jgi:hypothetical protein